MVTSVLIVDDHAGFRGRARQLLERSGFLVVAEAGDGASALAATCRYQPDVVLLDVQLPDTDGITLAPDLAAACPRARIVFVSVRDASSYGHRLTASCAVGFLTKDDLSGPALRHLVGAL